MNQYSGDADLLALQILCLFIASGFYRKLLSIFFIFSALGKKKKSSLQSVLILLGHLQRISLSMVVPSQLGVSHKGKVTLQSAETFKLKNLMINKKIYICIYIITSNKIHLSIPDFIR